MSRLKTVNEYIIEPPDAWILCVRRDESVVRVAIDASDVPAAMLHKWSIAVNGRGYHAVQTSAWFPGVGQKNIRLVRYLLNAPDGVDIDHIDRDSLNCRRGNLRFATRSQNCLNLSLIGRGELRTRGVTVQHGRYQARVQIERRTYRLGLFTDLDAARLAAITFRAERAPFSEEDKHYGR